MASDGKVKQQLEVNSLARFPRLGCLRLFARASGADSISGRAKVCGKEQKGERKKCRQRQEEEEEVISVIMQKIKELLAFSLLH
jgi:hypothetical protein